MSNFLLIAGKDVNYGASKTNTGANTASRPHELRDGAVGWFDAADNQLISSNTTVQDTPSIYLARGLSGNKAPIRTPILDARSIKRWFGKPYQPGTVGRQYVGFNGTNNVGINLVDDGEYRITVTHTSSNLHKPPFNFSSASSNSSANGFDIARQCARGLNEKQDSANIPYAFGETERIVKADVLVNTSSSNLGTTGTVRFGSDTIELAGSASISAGDTLRVGSTSSVSSPVYLVREVNGTTVTIDREFAGDTDSGVALGIISGRPADTDEAGLVLDSFEPGVDFHVNLQGDFTGTPTNWAQRPVEPVNTYDKIKTLEEKSNDNYNLVHIPLDYPSFLVDGQNYDVYEVDVQGEDLQEINRIVNPASPLTIKIAVPNSPGTFSNSDFEVINSWFASSPISFANVTL